MTDSKVKIDVDLSTTPDRVTATCSDYRSRSTAVLSRTPGAERLTHIPIGTRKPADLTLTVDEAPATVTPGPGGLTRGSYKVTVELAGVTYLFKPTSSTESTLLRDNTKIGEFSRTAPTEVKAWWESGADATSAAIGYALAESFGTGKKFFLMALLEDGSTNTAA